MAFSVVNASSLAPGRGPHPAASAYDKRITDHLGVTGFAVYQVEVPPGERTEPHDHLEDGVEDVYAVVRGSGWVVVDDETTPIGVGDFVGVSKEATRYVLAGDEGCDLIAVCG
ncbi:cupin domain-containing protein [Nocardioides sp. ChNu-153]|uniref:cupin domain-containing protein n=1 Tax=unclassified Nocardioides TaxID=2615069 RepID=UPI0024065668|nr:MULTISPECIES: cupin domain-containing protein [unclassified Nocardioides]MDF9716660.1 cupin domain-containing protein [Nocardioides sp. ChNu-99]MDN7123051.1 cupin domain-containing protein [Nocardioides sp. ChNu-153]